MIDLDKIENSVNQLMRMYPKDTRATQTIGDVHEIITRLRQAEKDAARYRWLKEQPWFECEAEWNMPINLDADGYSFSEAIDAVIDEAMNGSNN